MNMQNMCLICKHCRSAGELGKRRCLNTEAFAVGYEPAVRSGWFKWPDEFDPTFLESCDGFEETHPVSKNPIEQTMKMLKALH